MRGRASSRSREGVQSAVLVGTRLVEKDISVFQQALLVCLRLELQQNERQGHSWQP